MFRPVGECEFSFRGSLSLRRHPVLSAVESSDSCVPYDVPVVSEFVDIFSDELPGLPPHRKLV